jgi:hypothetical protein
MRVGQIVVDVAPLRESRDFRWLYSGRLVASAGTVVAEAAANWQVYALTRSPLAVGLLSLSQTVGLLISLMAGGMLADRPDRRALLLATGLPQAGLAAALMVNSLLRHPALWAIYAITLAIGLLAGIGAPASTAATPALVGTSRLPGLRRRRPAARRADPRPASCHPGRPRRGRPDGQPLHRGHLGRPPDARLTSPGPTRVPPPRRRARNPADLPTPGRSTKPFSGKGGESVPAPGTGDECDSAAHGCTPNSHSRPREGGAARRGQGCGPQNGTKGHRNRCRLPGADCPAATRASGPDRPSRPVTRNRPEPQAERLWYTAAISDILRGSSARFMPIRFIT